ncbi:flagellar basal-body rod modification protein FlgD [Amorphus suaedae]
MTDVASLTGNSTFAKSQSKSDSQTSTKTPDYNAFLQLLVTQLKNQDPTEPVDSTQYMSQLATFSQVEQQMQSNAKLESLLTSSTLSLGESVIGRTVTSADGSESGEVVSVKITSDGPQATLANGSTLMIGAGVVVS